MTRPGIAFLGLLLLTTALVAQEPASSSSADMQKLHAEVEQLTSALQSMHSELQACRDEIHSLRTELETAKSAQQGSTGDGADSAHAVADLREEQAVTDSRLATLYQSKVESGSKYRVRLSGLALFNTFVNRGTVNTTSVPNLALPTPEGQAGGSIGGTFRQTLFTLQAFGPEVGGAKTSAAVQFDFYGGFTRTLDGYVLGIAHLRTADIAFEWKKWSLNFMQDKPFISPLSPTTLAAIGTPEFAYSGDLWTWTPQIVAERTWEISERVKPHLQFGVLDPFDGELPTGFYLRQPEAGELSRTPGIAARPSLDFPIAGQIATIGAGGYFARQNYGYSRVLDAWAATLDWNLPFGERWALSGELHRGRGLGGMWGAIGTSVVYSAPETSGYANIIGVNTVGGWAQLKFKPTVKWEVNSAFGEESPFSADLRQNGDPTYLPILRNWTTMVNVIERPRSNLLLSLEYRHLNTVLFGGQTKTAEHINLGVGMAF